jgi:hypothetical protein
MAPPLITHRQWRDLMTLMIRGLEEQLKPAMGHITADVNRAGGQRTLRAELRACNQGIDGVTNMGKLVLGAYNLTLTGVSQAQQAAGGTEEVAADKHYHQN